MNSIKLPSIAGVIEGASSGLLGGIGDIFEKLRKGKVDIETANQQVQVELDKHKEAVLNGILSENTSYLNDLDSSRKLQGKALDQTDLFSKRFIYYLTIAIVLLVFGFDFSFFMVKYPPKNSDMINMLLGTLNSTCLVMVLGFFYGSTHNSKIKDDTMSDMAANINNK